MLLANHILAMLAFFNITPLVFAKNEGGYSQCKGMQNCDKEGELRCEQFENGRWISHCNKGCRMFLEWSDDCDTRTKALA